MMGVAISLIGLINAVRHGRRIRHGFAQTSG